MLDHIGIQVSDVKAAEAFYNAILEPLGYKKMIEPVPGVMGFGQVCSKKKRTGKKRERKKLHCPRTLGHGYMLAPPESKGREEDTVEGYKGSGEVGKVNGGR